MQYITIASTGDATDFGDLSYTVHSMNACASSTRGLFGSGFRGTTPLNVGDNTINYISIQSTGNAFDFGDLNRQLDKDLLYQITLVEYLVVDIFNPHQSSTPP